MEYKISYYNYYYTKEEKYYALNFVTKSIVELEENEYNILLENNIEKIRIYFSENQIYNLYNNGFLVYKNFDEIKNLEYLFNYSYFNTDFIQIAWSPTLKCNFSCPYCFELEKNLKVSEEKFNSLKKFFSKLIKEKRYIHIGLFGGEPLLEWDKIDKLFNFIFNKKDENIIITTSIVTNGFLFNKKIIEKLMINYNLNSIQITIDGNKKTHNKLRKLHQGQGTYDRILKNIKEILELSKRFDKKVLTLRINLFNNELYEINETLSEFSETEKKYFNVYFKSIYNTINFKHYNKNEKDIDIFYKLAFKNKFKIMKFLSSLPFFCEGSGNLNQIYINPDNSIWKCTNDLTVDKAKIGYLTNEGNLIIESIKLKNWYEVNPFSDKKCRKCKYLPICWGGCPLYFAKHKKHYCISTKKEDILTKLGIF